MSSRIFGVAANNTTKYCCTLWKNYELHASGSAISKTVTLICIIHFIFIIWHTEADRKAISTF